MTKKETKSEIIRFRVTPSEANEIFKCAAESELDPADYLRRICMKGIIFRMVESKAREVIQVKSIDIRKADEVGEKQRKHGTG